MCDYSLYTTPNRLAEEGEELVLHRFDTGTLGFAPSCDLAQYEHSPIKNGPPNWWCAIKAALVRQPRSAPLPAICIPPGTRLILSNVPNSVQKALCMESPELVVFTEISSRSYSYRDALLLSNGTRVLLQDLPEGIQALVLSTSPAPVEEVLREHAYAA